MGLQLIVDGSYSCNEDQMTMLMTMSLQTGVCVYQGYMEHSKMASLVFGFR